MALSSICETTGYEIHDVQRHSVGETIVETLEETDDQGHPTSIFRKYQFGRQFQIWNFRNISCKISCLPASPRIFEHLNNGIIAHFNGFLP